MDGAADTQKIAIVGRGLIGRSLELALRARDADVIALDKDDPLARASSADLIFLAAPIPENIRILDSLALQVPGDAIVSDTGSTKSTTVAAAAGLPARLRFIGGHPIAGAAFAGPDAARGDLFNSRPWVLTPGAATSQRDLETVRSVIASVGAVPFEMDAAEHDRLFAYLSHLPQLAVSALMHVVGSSTGEEGLALAGSGLRDSTRLANSPAALWQQIVEHNGPNVGRALSELIDVLVRLRDDHGASIPETFESATRWKRALDRSARK